MSKNQEFKLPYPLPEPPPECRIPSGRFGCYIRGKSLYFAKDQHGKLILPKQKSKSEAERFEVN